MIAQVDTLYISHHLFGTYKVVKIEDGHQIKGPKAVMSTMDKNTETYKYMKNSANSLTASKIFMWTGAATALSFLAINENNPEIGSVLLASGFSAMVLSTSFYFLSKKQAKKSVGVYNEHKEPHHNQSSLQFGISPAGIRLAYSF